MKSSIAVLSGIQPSGKLHIGNYFGALKQWIELQDAHAGACAYCIVDLHAITVPYKADELKQRVFDTAVDFLALGLDPKKAILFVQSHLPEHSELMWLLNTLVPFGELRRMTQWKNKTNYLEASNPYSDKLRSKDTEKVLTMINSKTAGSDKKVALNSEEVESIIKLVTLALEYRQEEIKIKKDYETALGKTYTGLLNYPILMAADILLYKAMIVPVGEDQQQHVELARIVARKFNNVFGEVFPEPQPKLSSGARIMSLSDPKKKMSKSDGEKSYIALDDDPEIVEKKIKKAVTETSLGDIRTKELGPGAKNLLQILRTADEEGYSKLTNQGSFTYAELKKRLSSSLADHFADYREKRKEIATNPDAVWDVLKDGADRARKVASATLAEVKERMGFRY